MRGQQGDGITKFAIKISTEETRRVANRMEVTARVEAAAPWKEPARVARLDSVKETNKNREVAG